MSTDKYASFYEEAPTFSEAIAALEDKECPEQVVTDILSFKILPTDDGTIGDRLTKYYYLLPAGIQNRVLSSDALDQIFNVYIEWIDDDIEDSSYIYATEMVELFEGTFCGLLEQENLSSETLSNFAKTIEKLSKALTDLQDSGLEEDLSFWQYYGWLAPIFEALAAHPNSTKEQKEKCLELAERMKTKEAEAE